MPVTILWGVGEERAKQLARLEIRTVEDLLLHQPRRYEDRRHLLPIAGLELKTPATVRGRVIAAGTKTWRKGARALFECILDDGTARLHLRWWQAQAWMDDYYAVGQEFLVFGKPESLRPRTMDHPETERIEPDDEFIHVNRIVPIHPLTEGLSGRVMRTLIWRALERFAPLIPEPRLAGKGDHRAALPSRAQAIQTIHFPREPGDASLARQRLALDEFVELQLKIQQRRKSFELKSRALPCGGDQNRLIKPFLAQLGFKLTPAQSRVLREIRADMSGAHPMRRLLQGDVGSGKTAVAACAALMALESGFNVALMAPTEILAAQHERNFRRWCEPLGVCVEMQTGNRKNERAASTRRSPGQVMFIGTHALFTLGFDMPKLGLVIIDEQHKFGVSQREQLLRKGVYPHLLVMTATPIPRTLALTLYGDLDVSTIDEVPAGRGSVKTFVRTPEKLPQVWKFIREKLRAGRQVYVVYPRVEEGGERDLKAVTQELERVTRELAPHRVGLVHGGIKPAEKEAVMTDFHANRIQVLLATSLIEVGVDVPNATIMLVENAESFGLAQLHQLRGRIGRGAHDSFCILISATRDPEVRERLRVLETTTDGFRIAEADLKLRGPGELLGQQQSGLPRFRFGNLNEDLTLIRQAKEIAAGLLA